jgi:peroxiredoxin Q/BCP
MLEVGDKAPAFDLMADNGKQVRLKDLKGRTVILYFYPKDDTPGCTQEACAFRDDYSRFAKKAVLLGVSLDNTRSHQSFKRKFQLPFPLLSDEGARVSRAYGVYKQKSMYGRSFWGIVRSTFVIGPDGRLKAIFPKVRVDGHALQVLEALG